MNTSKFDGDDIATATGILGAIQKKEFVFMLVFMNTFLNLISPADKILQSRDISFREAVPVIQSVKTEIAKLRTDQSFKKFWDDSEELVKVTAESLKTVAVTESQSRPQRNIRRPASLADYIITDCIGERNMDDKIEITSAYYYVLDTFLRELQRRFENNTDILEAISTADQFDNKLLKPLQDIGITLPSDEEMVVAKNYIARRREQYEEEMRRKDEKERESFKNRFSVLKELFVMKEAFPKVYTLWATIETFGCSTATAECSFSALERLGIKSRMGMKTDRLRHLTFLSFESKRLKNISYDEIMKIFNQNPKRRIQLY